MKHLEHKTIFMVEDDALNSAIIRTILRQNGARVPYDHWGDKTLQRMTDYPFPIDLVILDLMLPGDVTGHDIFEEMKKHDELKHIPVVAVSAADPDVEIPRTRNMGFDGFISKPINRIEFPHQLTTILDGTQIWGG